MTCRLRLTLVGVLISCLAMLGGDLISASSNSGPVLAGYASTRLSAGEPGILQFWAVPLGSSPASLEITSLGQPVGLSLRDDGSYGDAMAGDGLYQLALPLTPGSGFRALLELRYPGSAGSVWPYLVVQEGGASTATPTATSPPTWTPTSSPSPTSSASPPPSHTPSPTQAASSTPTPALTPAFLYKDQVGPQQVANIASHSLTYPANGRSFPIRITYPAAGGPYPVIVFSHGLFGSKDNYQPLRERWVSHGYVVILPTHRDSLAVPVSERANNLENWAERPGEISTILDELPNIISANPALADKIDSTRMGVGGHSFGAATSQLLGGATVPQTAPFTESRFRGTLLISPQGTGQVHTATSWESYVLPMFVITGTLDVSPIFPSNPYTWRTEPYHLANAGDKHLAVISGADHGFGNIAGSVLSTSNEAHRRYVYSMSLAYWDWYLKEEPDALAYLRSTNLNRVDGGIIFYEYK